MWHYIFYVMWRKKRVVGDYDKTIRATARFFQDNYFITKPPDEKKKKLPSPGKHFSPRLAILRALDTLHLHKAGRWRESTCMGRLS
jgi:hypothetical protein